MADDQLDDGSMIGGGGLDTSVDQSQQQAPPQALAQSLMAGMGNGMGPSVPQQPSAGVQAARKHGGLLTGLVGVLLDGLSAGVRTPQGPQGFSQSAQMAAQMPMQRQQQQMALKQQQMQFGTQQELQKAQIAQAHVQQLQARLMAASLDDEVASGMSDAAWKFAQNSIEQGTAKSVSGLGSREAAFDKLKELHDSSSAEEQGNLFAFPSGKDKDGNQQWGVYQVFPNKTLQEDTKFHLDGDPDNGIPDIDKTYPAGTPMSVYTTDTSQLTRDLIAKHHTVAMMNKPDPTQVIQGQVGGQTQNILLNKRNAKQTVLGPAAPKAAATTPEDITKQAQMLVEGNLDPSQVTKRGGTQGAILSAADKYSQQKFGKPYDPAQQQEDYKFANNTQTQNTLKYLNSLTGNDNKSGNLGDLLKISDNITRTDFPALNNAAAWTRLQTGDPGIVQFKTTVTEVADQVAKILQGGGGGTSDAKLHQAQEMFNAGFSKDQLKAVASSLRDLLANRKRELIGDNIYLKKQYGRQAATADRDATVKKQIPLTSLPVAQ